MNNNNNNNNQIQNPISISMSSHNYQMTISSIAATTSTLNMRTQESSVIVDDNDPGSCSSNRNNDNSNDENVSENCRSRNSFSSILNSYSNNFYFDGNTFKQVKRLYCGMLMVAMAYSVTMVIMMTVLYKSIPETMHHTSIGHPQITGTFDNVPPSENNIFSIQDQSTIATFIQRFHHSTHSTRTHLDQVIAINFLTSILYLMAFYAAQKEFYHLTLAFTTTLVVSMIISSVKIMTEGAHFPNNLMGLLLRMSIVFMALIYLAQIRRKQMFINNAQRFWLNNPTVLSRSSTAQLINDILGSTTAGSGSNNKTDEHMINEYEDQPPDYEEALGCPMPYVQPVPIQQTTTYPNNSLSQSMTMTTTSLNSSTYHHHSHSIN